MLMIFVRSNMLRYELRAKHPGARIVYVDYYSPIIQFVLHAGRYGSEPSQVSTVPWRARC